MSAVRQRLLVLVAVLAVLAAGCGLSPGDAGVAAAPTVDAEPETEESTEPASAPTPEHTRTPEPQPSTAEPTPSPTPTEEPAETAQVPDGVPAGAQAGVVERIIDGDTIAVRIDEPGGPLVANASHTIRLLLIDTPETVAPGKAVECGGPEATEFAAKKLPVGSTVYLVADEADTDRYGRFLRYVWTEDGELFNVEAARAGVARFVVYQPNDRLADEVAAAEAEAKAAGRGMWGPPCDYDAQPPAPGPAPAPARAAAPAPAPAPAPAAAAHPAGAGCDPNYTPCVPIAPDVDCAGGKGDGPAYVQGPVTVIGTDIYGLDGNGDGIGCER